MSRKRNLIKGTLLLTTTGFITRFMGFFYRMFLSHTFGEESVGLYQLIFPIYALGFSFTSAGIEIILSRLIAKHNALGQKKEALQLLYTSIFITFSLSCIFMLTLQKNAELIAVHILKDERCFNLLILLSYTFPLSSIHSCICGYYLGIKKPRVPAVSQLFEQSIRIFSVCAICWYCLYSKSSFSITVAVIGLITGETASSLYCIRALSRDISAQTPSGLTFNAFFSHAKELLPPSFPLTASRISLNILQSIEAVSIPLTLQNYGMTVSQSLSVYGVLTGMALPCILFPSAISNSVSTMLLPEVAEIQVLNQRRELSILIQKVSISCIFMGTLCCASLLLFGQWIGIYLFHSQLAGDFITTLSWMCPFLYTNGTLISVINGIGKTTITFLINTISLSMRIASIFFLIPSIGIRGYLLGMLASQICVSILCLITLRSHIVSGQHTTAHRQTTA